MTNDEKDKVYEILKAHLQDAVDEICNEENEGIAAGYWGDNTASHMARASAAIIFNQAESHECRDGG